VTDPFPGGEAIALAIAAAAQREGLVESFLAEELERLIDAKMWHPRYLPMRPKRGDSGASAGEVGR
jgi:hypothetical protein